MKISNVLILNILLIVISCSQSTTESELSNKDSLLDKKTENFLNQEGTKVSHEGIVSDKNEEQNWSIEQLQKEFPYDRFDTILSNGYHLSFSYFKDDGEISKCLILKKGTKFIDTLNVMGAFAPDKNLGYIGGDFKDYFAFVQSYGSGNPHEMQLLTKATGDTIRAGYIVMSHKSPELLFYEDHRDEKLKIFDFSNNKDIDISDLKIDCSTWQLSDMLHIDSITKDEIFLEFEYFDGNKLKYKCNR